LNFFQVFLIHFIIIIKMFIFESDLMTIYLKFNLNFLIYYYIQHLLYFHFLTKIKFFQAANVTIFSFLTRF
jgi:hypothetical protein